VRAALKNFMLDCGLLSQEEDLTGDAARTEIRPEFAMSIPVEEQLKQSLKH